MKTLLTYTSLDRCYSNHEIKGDIALYSIYLELFALPLILPEEGMITYQEKNELNDYINPSKKNHYT